MPVKKKHSPPDQEVPVTEAPAAESAPDGGAPDCSCENKELAEWKDRFLRTAAEYENFRKRTQREKELLWESAKADTAGKLLPVLDNLDRALTSPCEDKAFMQGLEMIFRQTLEIFTKLGVNEIEAAGKPFDPNLMDAVMHGEDESLPENTVAEVFTKGYVLGEKVLRHAVVKVVN